MTPLPDLGIYLLFGHIFNEKALLLKLYLFYTNIILVKIVCVTHVVGTLVVSNSKPNVVGVPSSMPGEIYILILESSVGDVLRLLQLLDNSSAWV